MCQNLAKFYYTGATLKNFGHFEWVHFAFRKILSLLWQILKSSWQILIVEKDQMLNKQSSNLVTLIAKNRTLVGSM